MGGLEIEEQRTRTEVADSLRDLADQLDGDGDLTLELGGSESQLNPSGPITFELESESDWSDGDTGAKQRIELELVRWHEARTADEGSLDGR